MIKLIIFDLSGVCFTLEEPIYIERFAKENNLNLKEFDDFYQTLIKKAEVSEISGEEVWKRIFEKYKINYSINQIVSDMMDLRIAHKPVLDYVQELRKEAKVVFLTNYCKLYWDEIKKRFPMYDLFDSGFVSYEIKARKPAKECFEFIMKGLKVKPEEVIFLDDSLSNLTEAKKLGIHTINFTSLDNLKREISQHM